MGYGGAWPDDAPVEVVVGPVPLERVARPAERLPVPLVTRHSLTPWPSFPHTPAVIPAKAGIHGGRGRRLARAPAKAGIHGGRGRSAFTTSLSTGSYGMAKPYQVRQVLDAIAKMEEMQK